MTANVLGGLLIFCQPIVILSLTDERTLGVFSLLVSWSNIGLLLASFGIMTAFQRLGAHYLSWHRDLGIEIYRYLRRKSSIHLVFTSALLAAGAYALHSDEVPWVLYPAIVVVLFGLYLTRWYLIQARINGLNFWPNIFDQPLREGLFILFIAGSAEFAIASLVDADSAWQSDTTFLVYYAIAGVLSALAARYYLSRKRLLPGLLAGGAMQPGSITPASRGRLQRVWSGIARTSFPSELGIYLIKRIDVIIVGALVSTEASGIYFLLSRIAELPNLVAGSINVIIGPEFAKMKFSGQEKRKRTLYLAASILPALVTVAMILVVYLMERLDLFTALFQRALDLTVLYIFLCGYVVYFALGPSTVLLTMTGRQQISSLVTCFIIAFHLLVVTLLAYSWQEIGAAIAFVASISLQRIIEITIIYKKTKGLNFGYT